MMSDLEGVMVSQLCERCYVDVADLCHGLVV